MEARWTGPHQLLRFHNAHRYTIKRLVTNKEMVEHASDLEYYDDEIASTDEEMKSRTTPPGSRSPASAGTRNVRTGGTCCRSGGLRVQGE
jgi:hypothetical protein